MKLKSITLMLLLFLTLIISIGAISADDVQTDILTEQDTTDESVVASENSANILQDDADDDDDDDDDGSIDASAVSSDTSAPATANSTASSSTTKKIATKVSADQVANEYKKSKYFKIKVKDKQGRLVKNLKLKLKIYTGKKSKTYTVKTNYKGIAKFNTKKLKIGKHKVVISSANSNFAVSKTSKIFIGKKRSATLKLKTKKVLKNKDVLALKVVNDEDEKDVKVVFKKKSKHTILKKAVFYLKNIRTGKTIKKTDNGEFDDGRWETLNEDFSNVYRLVKVKVWYISY